MGISTEELGPTLEAHKAFKGQEVSVTPLIGKLRLHVQDYTDNKEFFVSPLVHKDVNLGTPWFHKNYANLKFSSTTITLRTRDRQIKLRTEAKGNTIAIVSSNAIQNVIKKSLFAYMISIQRCFLLLSLLMLKLIMLQSYLVGVIILVWILMLLVITMWSF